MLCRIGDIEVWRVLDWHGLFLPPEDLFPNAPQNVAQIIETLAPGSVDAETGRVILPVQGFLLKTPQQKILVDTCIGNNKTCTSLPFWGNLDGHRFLAAISAAGVAPCEVDRVLFTHLHVDHVGWNTIKTDDGWSPSFPNARYLMPKADEEMLNGRGLATYDESIAPIIKAGQADLIDETFGFGDRITLIPTPGHTPGHVSVLLRSGGQEAVLTGDALHSTAQCQHPNWQFKFDWDADLAVSSRKALLETCVKHDLIVIGSHFVLPSIGRIAKDGEVFRWEDL